MSGGYAAMKVDTLSTLSVFAQLPGDAGVDQTVAKMKALVHEDMLNPDVRNVAARITSGCHPLAEDCKWYAIITWVKQHVLYTNDPYKTEYLTGPRRMIADIMQTGHAIGDCDEMSTLIAAMGKAVGLRPLFRVVGLGKRFQHIYVLGQVRDKKPIHLDCTRPLGSFNAPHVGRSKVVEV